MEKLQYCGLLESNGTVEIGGFIYHSGVCISWSKNLDKAHYKFSFIFFQSCEVNLLKNKIELFCVRIVLLWSTLRGGLTRLKITWVQQRQHHKAQESARERMLSLALIIKLSKKSKIWLRMYFYQVLEQFRNCDF